MGVERTRHFSALMMRRNYRTSRKEDAQHPLQARVCAWRKSGGTDTLSNSGSGPPSTGAREGEEEKGQEGAP